MKIQSVSIDQMQRPPNRPGEIFEEEYRKPSGISQAEAARRMGMSANRLNEIVKGKRTLSDASVLAFARLTQTSPTFWFNLQRDFDLWCLIHSHSTAS